MNLRSTSVFKNFLLIQSFSSVLGTFQLMLPTVLAVGKFPVSHGIPQIPADTLCPVVIRSISEHFCDYHGT